MYPRKLIEDIEILQRALDHGWEDQSKIAPAIVQARTLTDWQIEMMAYLVPVATAYLQKSVPRGTMNPSQ